jgi:hypothetical protein
LTIWTAKVIQFLNTTKLLIFNFFDDILNIIFAKIYFRMSKITYRLAKENDFSAIIEMIKELAIFENAAEKVINTTEIMAQEQNLFKCFVAENENKEIIGMALYFIAYFT